MKYTTVHAVTNQCTAQALETLGLTKTLHLPWAAKYASPEGLSVAAPSRAKEELRNGWPHAAKGIDGKKPVASTADS
jgi:hypothetical protein